MPDDRLFEGKMDASAWGVIEIRPGTSGESWINEWLRANEQRLEWASSELDDVRYRAHEQYAERARNTVKQRPHSGWIAEEIIDPPPNALALQCLWGVTDAGTFTPVAPDRGLPQTISPYCRAYHDSWQTGGEQYDCFGETHITAAELDAVDWLERAMRRRLFVCRQDGEKIWLANDVADVDLTAEERRRLDDGAVIDWERNEPVMGLPSNQVWLTYDRYTRREATAGPWHELVRRAEQLADEYGGKNVRLTVWFDR